ncbi:hypothetical protein FRE64_04555 [Euhalothece natronophila Z-M001]|uniref:Uncharacterized protein n=1 Tax=Euhalothece natronophila Z-M001 TaxID=522448 RepID=A0A5B8NJX3_9CHRO|nr:hypothetical protein [Euhalothece natronophila]QDZ39266.1 hypothetical protein FRE64_04555 [Euhalothece natronophila Z-M001]
MKPHPSATKLTLYLIPIFGVIPALWQIYHSEQGTFEERQVSRFAIVLALSWLITYSLLGVGGEVSPSLIWSVRFLYLDALITSGYFITCLVLMIQTWRGNVPNLPAMKALANKLFRSH